MTTDSVIDDLLQEVSPILRDTLRRAYELGYRDAIAREPDASTAPDETLPIDRLISDEAPSSALPDARPPLFAWESDSVEDEDDDETVATTNSRVRRRRRGIMTTSTIGLLKRKIQKDYRLDRFGIDITISLAGDRERRQLPSHVKLAKYLIEE